MSPLLNNFTGAILLSLILLVSENSFASRTIRLVDVPSEVVTAIEKKFTGAKMLDAEVDQKKNKTIFEVEICHKKDLYEVTSTKAGKILNVDFAGTCA